MKTLAEERQEQIAEYAQTHSWPEVVAWLKADGFVTSRSALSEWFSWWSLRQQLRTNETTVETVLEQLKRGNPKLTEEELTAAGQAFFSALAIEQRDAKSWKRIQDVRVKSAALELETQRFQVQTCELFLKWCQERSAMEIVESKAKNADKIEALRELMFGDLEAGGSRGDAESAEKN